MERRDILKDQIEQLGRVLGKILANFLGLKSEGRISQGIEMTNKQLQLELDIDIEKITTFDGPGLRDYLKGRKLVAEHLEKLSDYLAQVGKFTWEDDKQKAKRLLETAIELLDIADEISKTASFDRVDRRHKIEEMLQRRM